MLIFCTCGCGQLLEEFDLRKRKRKYIRGHNKPGLGKKRPDQSIRMKINNPMNGKPSPMKDKHHTDVSRLKMRKSHMGIQAGEKHPNWRGGNRLTWARSNAKRKQFGFIPLNNPEVDGWVGHHIDWDYVIFIPEKLHKSVYHSVQKDINMDIINDRVYEWFVDYYFRR